MVFFSKLRRSRQQAKEQAAKQAQKHKEQPAPTAYKHVPRHAGIDALSGTPTDDTRAHEMNRRRSVVPTPTEPAGTARISTFSLPAQPSLYGTKNMSTSSLPSNLQSMAHKRMSASRSAEDLTLGGKATATIFIPAGASTRKSRTQSFIMPSADDSQGALFGDQDFEPRSINTRHSMGARVQAAEIWYGDPAAPPVPSIPEEFVKKMNKKKRRTVSSVHVSASSMSSTRSGSSSSSSVPNSSAPSTPSTAKTSPRTSTEKPVALATEESPALAAEPPAPAVEQPSALLPTPRPRSLARPPASHRRSVSVILPSRDPTDPAPSIDSLLRGAVLEPRGGAKPSNAVAPATLSQARRQAPPTPLKSSLMTEGPMLSPTGQITPETALRSHALPGLGPSRQVDRPEPKPVTKRRRFSLWTSRSSSMKA